VRKGNSFQECLADYPVYLRVDSQGNQDIRCYILRKSS
jgi:hypothetical protein